MREDDAFEDGYDAYWDGIALEDCEFKPDTAKHRAWDEGWTQAQLEAYEGRMG